MKTISEEPGQLHEKVLDTSFMIIYNKLFFEFKAIMELLLQRSYAMNTVAEASIWPHFTLLTDPRQKGKIEHMLQDIIIITLCAVISGADTWPEIYAYGKAKQDWLGTFTHQPNGIPSADTFRRVFMLIDKDEFKNCFISWINAVETVTEGQVIAIDGKTNRGTRDKASGQSPIHVVSARASENRITLGQVKTEAKSNVITAIPELLNLLEIKGCIVTIDAMGCQKAIAEKIIDKEADYVLALYRYYVPDGTKCKSTNEGCHELTLFQVRFSPYVSHCKSGIEYAAHS